MIALELALALTPRQPTSIAFALDLDLELRPRQRGARWVIVAVDMDGVAHDNGWLDNAVLASPVDTEPCKAHTVTFTMPVNDPKSVNFDYNSDDATKYQEIQIWLGDRCVFWGPAHSPEWGDTQVTVQCSGFSYYPSERRAVGPARRLNMLRNGIFYGLQYWSPLVALNPVDEETGSFTAQDVDTNLTVTTVHPANPLYGSLRIEDRSPQEPDGQRLAYAAQDVRFNAGDRARTVRFRARAYLDAFDGANIRRSGLALVLLPVGYTDTWTQAVDFKVGSPTLDENFPLLQVTDMSCDIELPPANPWIVQARLEGPKGVIEYTDAWVEYDDALALHGDQTSFIFVALVDHLTGNQAAPWLYSKTHPNSPWANSPYEKSDVKINVDAPASHVIRDRNYLFEQRTPGGSAMNEFEGIDNGFEWEEACTRNLRYIRTGHPKIGRYRPDCRLVNINGRGNVPRWDHHFLGEQGATSFTVAPVSGGWRAGAAIDTAAFGGLTLEDSMSAPAEVNRDALDPVAQTKLRSTTRPETISALIPFELYNEQGLRAGDRVSFDGRKGDKVVSGVWWLRRLGITDAKFLPAELVPWPY